MLRSLLLHSGKSGAAVTILSLIFSGPLFHHGYLVSFQLQLSGVPSRGKFYCAIIII